MGQGYTKTYNVTGVTFTNDDGTNRQDILAHIAKQQELGAPDPKFRFENGIYEGADSIAVYVDEKKVGFIAQNEVEWLNKHMDEAESIDSYEIIGSGLDGYALGLRLVVSFKGSASEPAAPETSTRSIKHKDGSKVVVCQSCGKETVLDKECRHCGATVLHTGGGVFAENWSMLLGFAFLSGMFGKLGLGLSVSTVTASTIIAYAAAAIFFAVMQLNVNRQRLKQEHCAIIHDPFKFRPWYLLYIALGFAFAFNWMLTI